MLTGSTVTLKGPMNGSLLVFAYTSFIICVVMIHRDKELFHSYPAAVVAQMVCAIVQMLYMFVYFLKSHSKIYSVRNMFIVNGLLMLYCFGASIAITVLGKRHGDGYCPGDTPAAHDCQGVLRGTMGMAWVLWIWNIFWMAIIAMIVSTTNSSWSEPLGNVPVIDKVEEEAPKH